MRLFFKFLPSEKDANRIIFCKLPKLCLKHKLEVQLQMLRYIMEILPELCHLFQVRVKGREELSSTGYTEVRTSSGSTEIPQNMWRHQNSEKQRGDLRVERLVAFPPSMSDSRF